MKAERAALIPHSPPTAEETAALAAKLAAKLKPLETTFFRLADADPARPTEPSNPDFVGRARELLELHAALWPDAPGVEGTGSAQALADEYARRFARSYPRGTFRLNLLGDGETEAGFDGRINSLLRTQAETLGLTPDPAATTAALRGALERAFQNAPPYLWRVDDMPEFVSAAQVQALRAPTSQGATLFTSRYELPSVEAFRLKRLEDADAHRLIRTIAGDRAAATDRQRLIDTVDGHALSLRLLAFRLKATGDAAEILATLELAPLEGLKAFATRAALRRADLTKGVYATLVSSFHLLEEGGEARALLALLADLALAEPGFANAPQLVGWLAAIEVALLTDMQAIVGDIGHYRRDPLSGWLLPHARLRGEMVLARGKTDLGSWVGLALYHLGDLPGVRALQEQVLEIRRRILGPEHLDTLTSMSNLAETLYAQGDLAATRTILEELVEALNRTLGVEHGYTLDRMATLALVRQAAGDAAGARAIWQAILDARRGRTP